MRPRTAGGRGEGRGKLGKREQVAVDVIGTCRQDKQVVCVLWLVEMLWNSDCLRRDEGLEEGTR